MAVVAQAEGGGEVPGVERADRRRGPRPFQDRRRDHSQIGTAQYTARTADPTSGAASSSNTTAFSAAS